MTRRARWMVLGACEVLILLVGLFAWLQYAQSLRAKASARKARAAAHEAEAAEEAVARDVAAREAEAVAAREAVYWNFGIAAPGTRRFVPLPPQLPSCDLGRAQLGKKLFNDRRLTSSRIASGLVCGACHHLGAGGTDSKAHHGVLTRPVYNAAFATSYLHDGSLSNLHEAVGRMIEHPHFSGGGPLAGVAARLAEDAATVKQFQFAYEDGLTGTNVVDAVVEYLKTRVTANTSFDDWCAGHTDSLSAEQRRGSEVFVSARCMDCHESPVLGARKVVRGAPARPDQQLKVPALRGLGLRKAYLTEGKVKDLDAVVPMMPGGDLSPEDKKALVDFLKAL